ncbi:MAG: outer membrane lipoprotein carrier protein LolA [Salinivirgaceae bacterium]|nr:outer membrane lipoprotein carrier protein LolA [Salinivirgaceae bacterium]MDD4746346.1 outer membrane lipoprotein carrier protein LolA [Salinivirgaceae bacterium]MDY0281111.1 outer membrane lipoprotein carrier protein LolA [Salinivirgaceae bacterium]
MKRNFLLLFTLCAFLNLNAQHDPEARKVLDNVSKTTKSWSTAKIEFKATFTSVEPETTESHKGTLWQKGEKYKLVFMGSHTFCNGINKWVFMPEVDEVNFYIVDKSDKGNLLDNPQQIFNLYTDGYKYATIGEQPVNGKTIVEIELVPEDKNVEFFKIKVFVDKTDMRLTKLQYYAKDGGRATIEVLNYKIGDNLADKFFVFDEKSNPDAIIIDMTE